MTRRIALAILLIVWLSLLTAGISTYFITRTMLISDLDQTILGRVSSLPELERPAAILSLTPDTRDRFVIQNPQGNIISSSSTPGTGVPPPIILNAGFTRLSDGSRLRSLTIRAFARRQAPADPLVPVTVVYSAPADHVDALLSRLLISLGGFGLFAAAATAAVSKSVARVALRPLRDTADTLGAIDEKTLDRRIDVSKLPSELVPVASRLNDMLARLETAFTQRKQFLADASHELRTPVAALVTTLEVILKRPRDAQDYHRALESCLTDARLLQHLVVGLLDQVRAERFGSELDLAPTAVSALLGQVAGMTGALASAKGIALHVDLPERLLLLTDEQKLRSIVTNLLSNAIEYAPAGGNVWLAAKLLPLEAQALPAQFVAALPEPLARTLVPRQLSIAVVDDGPGIPADHLPHLFEPFYRTDSARSDPHHHLGLGLALVRGYARSLGGDAQVRNRSDARGAEFLITFPAPEMHADTPADLRIPHEKNLKLEAAEKTALPG
jgi:signal transduction histidine kinase